MECHRNILAESIYDEYRHKILFLDIPNLLIKEEENKLNTSDEMNLVFTGMLSETNADCRYFLEVLKEICKTNKVIFHVYGGVSPVIERAFSETGMFGTNIIYHGRVSQNELIEVRNNATAFLNFGNNYECGIPCKIFEYISTGKMIISFAKIDEDASTPYLRRYDNALLLREDLTEIKHQAKVIIEFINLHKNVYISRSEVNREFFSNTPRAFVQMIHSIS